MNADVLWTIAAVFGAVVSVGGALTAVRRRLRLDAVQEEPKPKHD